MRNYGKPVTDDVVREFLPLDVALYSVWMPGDRRARHAQGRLLRQE
jgi:hypothetical protein